MLLLKLLLTPLIIIGVTLIGRRWGPRVAGLAVGLPLTTGPVSVFLAVERGPAFAAHAAAGAIAGLVGTGCFSAAYALVARRREWPASLAAALGALAAATLLLHTVPLPLGATVAGGVAALLALWAAVTLVSSRDTVAAHRRARRATPAWDLPARVLVSTAMVAGVTSAAGLLGPQLSGVLSALPVMGAVLGTFTHHGEGRPAAVSLMRGLIIGCVSGVAFLGVVGAALGPGALAATYGVATVAALVTGAAASWLNRDTSTADADAEAPLPSAAAVVRQVA